MAIQTQFSTDPNAIVTVHVSIVEAPTPINYQRTGAFVTFGGTQLAPGDTVLLTQLGDLIEPQAAMLVIAASWTAGTVSMTVDQTMPGVNVGDVKNLVITNMNPSGYNGTYPCTIESANSFSYPHAGTLAPAVPSSPGVFGDA